MSKKSEGRKSSVHQSRLNLLSVTYSYRWAHALAAPSVPGQTSGATAGETGPPQGPAIVQGLSHGILCFKVFKVPLHQLWPVEVKTSHGFEGMIDPKHPLQN